MWHAFDMGMHKEFGVIFDHHVMNNLATDDEIYQAKATLKEKLLYLDEHLMGKEYIECERLTYADLVMFTRLQSLAELGASQCIDGYKNILRWIKFINAKISGLKNASKPTTKEH